MGKKLSNDPHTQGALNLGATSKPSGPTKCLGMTFDNDEARRRHFTKILADKLKDPEFRKKQGFPTGNDEDILRMSDPPYYTACPNPFIGEFIEKYGTRSSPDLDYHCEPFATDVSEGKTDTVYIAHSYHTKVPHKAIMRYILHYTKPGDVVFDGFCGTGMTAVAAQACGSPEPGFRQSVEASMPDVQWGARRAVVLDISPAATFIAQGYNIVPPLDEFRSAVSDCLSQLSDDCAPLYNPPGKNEDFHYAVWTDVFSCPECGTEFSFWEAAIDLDEWKVATEFHCPSCNAQLKKTSLDRVMETYFDEGLSAPASRGKYVLSVVNKTMNGVRQLRPPSDEDIELAVGIEQEPIPDWHPVDLMLFTEGQWGQMWRAGYHAGITHAHHFFTKRNVRCLARAWRCLSSLAPDIRRAAQYVFTGGLQISSRMSQFRFDSRRKGSTAGGIMKGALFVPSLSKEGSVPDLLERRFRSILSQYEIQSAWKTDPNNIVISTGSCADTTCPNASVDYIFIDPPFGANIIYSELSFLWEAWLRVFTSPQEEAIINDFRGKALPDYHDLMLRCFRECYRILKPGRWMTVEFHNSQNSVWNTIQEGIQRAGFVVADVRTLDKKQGSFKQLTTKAAVKQDLVISAYKPTSELANEFDLKAGTDEGVWSFINSHLRQVPIFVASGSSAETVAERLDHLLFDRMVAFHVQRAVSVPMTASQFYLGLSQRFPVRDGMYFLPDQVAEYDRRRTTVGELKQLSLFVSDEATAIQWARQQLHRKPQTFQELQPLFMQHLQAWAKHEKTIELKEILNLNFFCYDGNGPVPSQIHSYLSSNFKDLRKLEKDDPQLKAKAEGRWYVPDPKKEGDLEKFRTRTMLREFEEYKTSKQRKLKQFRTEAIRAGFKAAYDAGDYGTIVGVAAKIPNAVLQEDEKLLMYYDVATMRLGEEA